VQEIRYVIVKLRNRLQKTKRFVCCKSEKIFMVFEVGHK